MKCRYTKEHGTCLEICIKNQSFEIKIEKKSTYKYQNEDMFGKWWCNSMNFFDSLEMFLYTS